MLAVESEIGFYGKLPGRADFVAQGLPESFLTPMTDWIERGLAAGQAALGPRWTDAFLTGAAWHFALSAGLAGSRAAVGAMVPSADRTGRAFPLIIAALADARARPAALAHAAAAWLDRAAEIAATAVTRDIEPARLAALLAAAGPAWTNAPAPMRPAPEGKGWRLGGRGAGRLTETLPHLIDHAMLAVGLPSLWWSDGSAQVEPCTMVCSGLPDPSRFAAMIGG